MNKETNLELVEAMLEDLLSADQFLVGMKVKPTNNYKIYLDADQGITIESCIKINRALRKKMDEAGLHEEGDFSLEVSSPGLTEPLKLLRQYQKNVGRPVEVTQLEGNVVEGKLIIAGEDGITIEQTIGKGKKAETKTLEIPFSDIKQTVVQIKF